MEEINSFNKILTSFKIKALCVNFNKVDNYFYYDIKLNPSAKVKDLVKYIEEISLALRTPCKPSLKVIHNEDQYRK